MVHVTWCTCKLNPHQIIFIYIYFLLSTDNFKKDYLVHSLNTFSNLGDLVGCGVWKQNAIGYKISYHNSVCLLICITCYDEKQLQLYPTMKGEGGLVSKTEKDKIAAVKMDVTASLSILNVFSADIDLCWLTEDKCLPTIESCAPTDKIQALSQNDI